MHYGMNNQDIELLNECKGLIIAFKKHLSIINADYLSQHIIGVIRAGVVHYRNPENNWYYKNFCADIDDETKEIIGIDKQTGHYHVTSTEFRDYYLYDLINSLRVETEDSYNKDVDENRIKELEKKWKDEIISTYLRNEHIRRFVWDLKPFTPASKYSYLREDVLTIINSIIPNDVDFFSFISCGLHCQYLSSPNKNNSIRIVNAVGLFGNYVRYGHDKVILPDQKIVEIPSQLFAPGLRSCRIVEISKGVFESLHHAEVIKLPESVEKIEWSFWHCRNLKSIEVRQENKTYSSIDGVLYSKDHKVLYAYPNKHGSIYEVPEEVEIIEKFAFKDCDNIEMIMLPSSLKCIKLNAFYRATNLKKIICACPKKSFVYEGFYGDYGNVKPLWFYAEPDEESFIE